MHIEGFRATVRVRVPAFSTVFLASANNNLPISFQLSWEKILLGEKIKKNKGEMRSGVTL